MLCRYSYEYIVNRRERLKRKRVRMYNENSHCFYCNGKMILPFEPDNKEFVRLLPKRYRHPDNEATFEHVNSRLNAKRRVILKNTIRILLVCKKCNGERGAFEQSFLTKEELRERSQRHSIRRLK